MSKQSERNVIPFVPADTRKLIKTLVRNEVNLINIPEMSYFIPNCLCLEYKGHVICFELIHQNNEKHISSDHFTQTLMKYGGTWIRLEMSLIHTDLPVLEEFLLEMLPEIQQGIHINKLIHIFDCEILDYDGPVEVLYMDIDLSDLLYSSKKIG